VKNKIFSSFILFLLVLFIASSLAERGYDTSNLFISLKIEDHPQNVKKPKYDYMSTFLSRNTNPLGLKENIALKKYLNQPSIKWAVRAGEKHILQ